VGGVLVGFYRYINKTHTEILFYNIKIYEGRSVFASIHTYLLHVAANSKQATQLFLNSGV
jgi:hypothetical protein